MSNGDINYKLCHPDAKAPTRAHQHDAGNDLYSIEDKELPIGALVKIKTGLAISLNKQTVGLIKDRSSMGSKGLHVFAGVIDAGYTGEISVVLFNAGDTAYSIKKGEKVAQLLVMPVIDACWWEKDELESSARGDKGFGSSGK